MMNNEWTEFKPNWSTLGQRVEGKYKVVDNVCTVSCTVKSEPVIIYGLPTVVKGDE